VIPEALTPRDPVFSPLIGLALFLSFVLVSMSKLMKANMFEALATSAIKVQGIQAYLRESFPLNRRASFLLLANYLISFGLVLYLLSDLSLFRLRYEWWVNLIVPAALLFWSVLSMLFVGLLSGERQVFAEPLSMKIVGAQMLGIIYFVLALISTLYPIDELLFVQIVLGIFLLESVLRIFKSILVVLARGVSWYYIILYFCTLEILPLFVAYYVILRDFSGNSN
jgi:hypothetical protein